jgi:ParB family transcriptional regulator, chromosome partitioning protein
MSDKTSSESAVSDSARPAIKRKVTGLGRGLGALMGEVRREEALVIDAQSVRGIAEGQDGHNLDRGTDRGLAMLPISSVTPHPGQPRRHFDDTALDELAASIAARGVIQPIIVRPMGGGNYQLVAGERRWRAAQKAQLHEIPALVRDLADRDVMALALIENLQREDLNPVEEARAYHALAEGEGLSQAEIARMVDKSRSHVANFQRLLSLPDAVLTHIEAGRLSMGHARALIGHDDAESIAADAIARKLSVRDVEKRARRARSESSVGPRHARPARAPAENADIAAVQNHLEEFLGLAVRINADADPRSGAVVIRYRTLDQLDLICQRLTGGGI